MPAKNQDLHGNVPDAAATVLLVIDMINDLEYEGGDELLAHALPAAERIAALKRRARSAGIPAVYVNDNFGRWRSDLRTLLAHCRQDHICGKPLVDLLAPDNDDYFVLKPKHSAFYATPLDLLLEYLHARTLILTGISGDMCILFTASDAYIRDFELLVPQDCVASIQPQANQQALEQIQRLFQADTRPSTELDLDTLKSI